MEPTDDPVAEAAKLPLSERVSHKHWKVREAAYRELADKFNVAEENAKIYSDFLPSLSKIVRDSNAPAQLAGFDTLAKYADTAPPQLVRRVAADISKGIVEKGLAGRPANKAKAVEAFHMFVGADAGDFAVEALTAAGFKHRTPKVVAAAVDALTQAITIYGTGPVPVKTITSNLPPLFNHSQELVRNAAKALIIELHRWVGDPVKVVVKSAKEVTIKEVEAAFAKHEGQGKPKPQKLTRSMEKRVRERGGPSEQDDSDDGFGDGPAEEEELDLAEEINFIEKLSKVKITIEEGVVKDWYTAIDSKKWSARKDALDKAVEIIGEARLIPGNFQEVFTRLRKILAKDSNVNVVASAAKLIRAMCGGLKKNFSPGAAKALTVDLFGRLKEKNRIVVDSVSAALDALHSKKCIRIVELLEDISTAAKHKVPKARCELLSWLGRSIREGTSGADLKGAPLKCFGLLFLKATDDSAPEVRDAALTGLASLQKVVGDRNVAAYMEKLDKKRKDKVAAILKQLPESKPASNAKAKPSKAQTRNSGATSSRGQASSPGGSSRVKKTSASPAKRAKAAKHVKPKPYQSDDEGEISGSVEEALSLAEKRFEGFEKENWNVKSFKTRAAAAKLVVDGLGSIESFSVEDVSLALGLLLSPPGLEDSNFMAVKPKLELFALVSQKCASPLPRRSLRPLLRLAAEKFGDIKCSKIVGQIMITYAEVTSPRYLFSILEEVVRETKNNRAIIAILKFAGSLVEDFGIPAVPEKAVASVAVATMGNEAPAARNAAVSLACKASIRCGAGEFRKNLVDHSATDEILEMFDAELQKYSREPDPPTRKVRFGGPSPEVQKETGLKSATKPAPEPAPEPVPEPTPEPVPEPVLEPVAKDTSVEKSAPDPPQPRFPARIPKQESLAAKVPEAAPEEQKPQQPVERVSVAHEFAPGSRIFLDLKNSNWKKRQEALALVSSVISGANNFIKPDIGGDIVVALRVRLSDSNRNIAATAYDVVGRLILAMGPGGIMYMKTLAPSVLGHGCVDIKKTVREAAMRVLHNWYDSVGLVPLLPYCNMPLGSLNSNFRKEFLEWLVPRLQGEIGSLDSSCEDLSPLLDSTLACLRDRIAEVRHLADQMLEQVIRSVGLGAVESKLLAMPKGAKSQLEPVLEKYRIRDDPSRPEEALTPKISGIPTPRGGRERPRSVATPRTPLGRKIALAGEDTSTPGIPSARRPRAVSARVSPMVAASMKSTGNAADDIPILIPNDSRENRARRFLAKRQQVIEELAQTDPLGSTHSAVAEDLEDLANDLRECCSPYLCSKLTAPANRFRMHVEAVEIVSKHLDTHPETLRYAADVLLRWSACRIDDSRTPPTVLVKLAGFVSNICEILMSSGAKLGEYETCAVLPPVVEKCGSNRESLRNAMRSSLHSISEVVEDDVFIVLLTTCLKHPVSPRAHEEVSNEICRLIDKRCADGAGMPAGVLPTIGKVACGEDDGAGRAAAICLERAHEYFGDDLWNLVGELTDIEASYLDDRLNGIVGGNRSQGSTQYMDEINIPRSPGLVDRENETAHPSLAAPGPAYPSDIRNEDFRLSVAPAPSSSVMTSITESLNTATPMKTKAELRQDVVPETPALPLRSRQRSHVNDEDATMVSEIMSKLRSPQRNTQLSGLASVFRDLNNEGVLLKCEGGTAILLQLVKCFGETLKRLEQGTAASNDPAVLKSFLKGVIRFALEPQLLRRMDQGSVEQLLADALEAMIHQAVTGVEEWDHVRRGVNLTIVKVLESCDQNLLYTAMINLLLDNIRSSQRTGSGKMSPPLAKSSICIKSIAKVTRRGFAECRVNALLRDIHIFLTANPVRRDGVSSAEDQTFAMRLLKTVVNAIIDEIGADIRLHLDLIPQLDKSQLVHYIDMTLSDRKRTKADTGSPGPRNESKGRLKEAEMSLLSCLSKIEAGNFSDGSVRQVHSILMWCPEIDLKEQLAKFTPQVGSFVQEGLAKFGQGGPGSSSPRDSRSSRSGSRLSLDGSLRGDSSPSHQSRIAGLGLTDAISPGSSGGVHSAGQVYLKRLHEIQLRYGLQTGSRSMTNVSMGRVAVEKENGTMEKQMSGEEARGKASSLRERMARIRALQSTSKD
eukprot:GFKZ01002380.1.p1 GENE.GFKZ01002380.1~~GFKZ01002380.1.p1  ORF type:complete len:2108 (+),score=298.31 GFKZ01002380.1:243-6566(+)